eukprot:TRINITY_DN2742_c0_g1_i1.p1 TRINITY_DN2742_c0_g1~~TRINITY_DN2742_c0_g1_i1.p1  ORF type:complete len:180 (+),score=0.55 TRINITY_DN2742_c0_g1_i1:129-668(+)
MLRRSRNRTAKRAWVVIRLPGLLLFAIAVAATTVMSLLIFAPAVAMTQDVPVGSTPWPQACRGQYPAFLNMLCPKCVRQNGDSCCMYQLSLFREHYTANFSCVNLQLAPSDFFCSGEDIFTCYGPLTSHVLAVVWALGFGVCVLCWMLFGVYIVVRVVRQRTANYAADAVPLLHSSLNT